MLPSSENRKSPVWQTLLKPWHPVPWLVVGLEGALCAGTPDIVQNIDWPAHFWPTHLAHVVDPDSALWVKELPWSEFLPKQLYFCPHKNTVGYVLDSSHLALIFFDNTWDLYDASGQSLLPKQNGSQKVERRVDLARDGHPISTRDQVVYMVPADLVAITPMFLSAQWKMILESTPAAAMIATIHGFPSHVNDSYEIVTGYSRADVIGKKIQWHYVQEKEIKELEEAWLQVVGGAAWQGDLKAVRKDGTTYPEKITIWPLPEDTGEVHHVIIFKEDLSQVVSWKKELEERDQQLQEVADIIPQARLNEARYHSIIQASQTGAWEFDLKTGTLWISEEYYTMLGMIPENPNGDTFLGYEKWLSLVHPQDRYMASRLFQEYLSGNRDGIYVNSFRMIHASGDPIWVLSRGQEIRNKDGSGTSLILGVHINITELKKAEQIIKDRDAYHQALLGLMPDMLLVVDKSGVCLDFKPGQVDLLAPPESFLGKPLRDFIPSQIAELHHDSALKALKEQRMITIHYSAYIGEQERHYRSTIIAFGPDKTLSSISDITEDINRIQQLEKLLAVEAKQNQQLHEFAHIVSHHFRSQVSGLLGILGLMAIDEPERFKHPDIQWIQRASDQLQSTIGHMSQVLDLKRNIEGKWETVALGHFVNSLIPRYQEYVREIEGCVHWAPPAEEVYIYSVSEYLQSILHELVVNAIRFREEDKPLQLRISIEKDEKHVLLKVEDNGIGIEPIAQAQIFGIYKSFSQGPELFKGLGLFIAQHQSETLGGEITVDSKPGLGTVFTVRLPRLG